MLVIFRLTIGGIHAMGEKKTDTTVFPPIGGPVGKYQHRFNQEAVTQ